METEKTIPQKEATSRKTLTPLKNRDPGKITFAILLIFVGSIFLLNNLGIIPWNIWPTLLRFWPTILILMGIQLIIGNSPLSNCALGLLAVLLFSIITVTALLNTGASYVRTVTDRLPNWWTNIAKQAQEATTKTLTVSSSRLENTKEVTLILDIGAGKLTLSDTSPNSEFLQLDTKYYQDWGEPVLEETVNNKNLTVVLKDNSRNPLLGTSFIPPRYNIHLSPTEKPIETRVKLGAGKGVISLSEINLSSLNGEVGAGDMTIKLNENALPTGTVSLEAGAGTIDIEIPKKVEYHIEYSVGVGSLKTPLTEISGIGKDKGEITSKNYATADKRINFNINVGVGQVIVRNP